jgi:hypothetical protein
MTKKAVDELMHLVGAGSDINTDDFPAYTHLGGEGGDHRVVGHGKSKYTRGDDHVNTVEGVFQISDTGSTRSRASARGICGSSPPCSSSTTTIVT